MLYLADCNGRMSIFSVRAQRQGSLPSLPLRRGHLARCARNDSRMLYGTGQTALSKHAES